MPSITRMEPFSPPQYEIKCSWKPLTGNLRESILVEPTDLSHLSDDEGSALEHAISEETYMNFERGESSSDVGSPFTLSVVFKNPRCRLTKLSIASQARIIEIYGKHGEYLSTHQCDLLHEDDEYGPFYHAQPDVSSYQEVTVKLICRNSPLWVFGLKILYTIEQQSLSEPPSHFNRRAIEDILRGSNRPLSERAEKAMKFVELYCKATTADGPLPLVDEPVVAREEPVYRMKVNGEDEKSSLSLPSCSSTVIGELKTYVDASVGQVERRVTQTVDERLKQMEAKQDEKLNEIIRMLQNKS